MTFSSLNTNKLVPQKATFYPLITSATGTYQQFVYDSAGIRYLALRFTSSGSLVVPQSMTVQTLVVAGGGGGGGDGGAWGGAAGRGGNRIDTPTLTAGATYTISIGGGGGASYYGGTGGSSSISGTGVSLSATGGTGSGPNYSGTSGSPGTFPRVSSITGVSTTYSGYEDGTYGAAGVGYYTGHDYQSSGVQGVVVVLLTIGNFN